MTFGRIRKTCLRLALIVAGLALLSAPEILSQGRAAKKSPRPPNIIFILADDLGYGDLGSYGQRLIKTPNLDRMAAEGVRFTQFYAGAPVCAPSRASFMTGMHQGHAYIRGNTGLNNQRVSLRPQDVTVAQVLKGAGYRTGIVGKWGLGEPDTTGIPNRKGFDYWFGYLNQNAAHNYYPDYLWRNEERVSIPRGSYSHDLFTREALDFIQREHAQPFFLYLAYTIPHANNELGRTTGNGMEVPSDAPYTKQKWPQQEKNYAAMVTRMDADVGKILALLRQLGLDDNTVVCFSSDNGPQGKDEGGFDPSFFNSNGSLRGIKRELYEGGIRAPLVVRWPGRIKHGQTSAQAWASWDFLPTAAAIAGVRPPGGLDGVSMLPTVLGRGGPVGRQRPGGGFLYWEFHEGGYAQAVRLGRWKAVRHLAGALELYDLKTDSHESRNVAAKWPAVVREIEKIMRQEHVESEQWPTKR